MVYREKVSGVTRLSGGRLTLDQVWPINSVYISMDPAVNPGTLFGGTWAAIGQGRMLVGFDGTDVDFDTVGETGGEKKHTLTQAEMPNHSHSAVGADGTLAVGSTGSGHTHQFTVKSLATTTTGGTAIRVTDVDGVTGGTGTAGTATAGTTGSGHTHDISGHTATSGSDGAHNNMPPYLVVKMWRRTA